MYHIRRTDEEIDAMLRRCIEENGRFYGMTYEDGVEAGIRWLIGKEEEDPLDD